MSSKHWRAASSTAHSAIATPPFFWVDSSGRAFRPNICPNIFRREYRGGDRNQPGESRRIILGFRLSSSLPSILLMPGLARFPHRARQLGNPGSPPSSTVPSVRRCLEGSTTPEFAITLLFSAQSKSSSSQDLTPFDGRTGSNDRVVTPLCLPCRVTW